MNKKLRRVIVMLVIMLLIVSGCSGSEPKIKGLDEAKSIVNEIQNLAEEVSDAAQTMNSISESVSGSIGGPVELNKEGNLRSEYQIIVDEIYKAREKGYAYHEIMDFMVKGNKVKRSMMIGNSGVVTIGEKGNIAYEITYNNGEITDKVEVELDDLFGDYAASDMVEFYTNRLIGTLYAASNDMKFKESNYSTLILTEVMTEESTAPSGNPAYIITVNSYPDTMPDDAGYETYIISGGLLERYIISTPILNKGKESISDFEFVNRGPIDEVEFSGLE